MLVIPSLTIAGTDYSKLFVSSHSEQTTNDSKDENKYDVTLANGAGQLFGKFKPKDPIVLKVTMRRMTCDGSVDRLIHIFTGEVQKATCGELECQIEGSCKQGGMVSGLTKPRTWAPNTKIKECVNTVLDDFGYTGKRHIFPKNNDPTQHTPEAGISLDFNTAMQFFADEAGCNWFFDEVGDFWFVPPVALRGTKDLSGHVQIGQTGSTMVGLCTVVNVHGASQYKPYERGAVNPTHSQVHAQARADDPEVVALMAGEDMIATYGEILAPPIIVPNCDQKTCENIARSVLLWFLQFKDVPEVKVVGIAPVVFSRVAYLPFNGNPQQIACDENAVTTFTSGPVVGLVTKRIVDISASIGLECVLSVSTTFQSQLVGQNIYDDEDIINLFPGAYPIYA